MYFRFKSSDICKTAKIIPVDIKTCGVTEPNYIKKYIYLIIVQLTENDNLLKNVYINTKPAFFYTASNARYFAILQCVCFFRLEQLVPFPIVVCVIHWTSSWLLRNRLTVLYHSSMTPEPLLTLITQPFCLL